MAAEEILYWVGGLLLARYVGLPWIRTHVFGPPQVPHGWALATGKLGLVPTFVRRGLSWAIAVRLPIHEEESVELEARMQNNFSMINAFGSMIGRRAEFPREPRDTSTEVVVDARGLIAEGLIIRGKSRDDAVAIRRARTAKGEATDDLQQFFDSVSITGNDALVAALLDEDTRLLLRISTHDLGFVVDRGLIQVRAANLATNHPHLEQIFLRMTQLVRALQIREAEVLPRLEKIAAIDHCPEARARALEVMASAFPKERTKAAFERARTDESPIVRLQVVAAVPSAIEEVASILTDPLTRHATMRGAVRIAVRRFRRRDVERCLVKLFREHKEDQGSLRVALIEALGRLKSKAVADEIALFLEDSQDGTREAAVRALGMIGASQYEQALIARLADADVAVAGAAIRALANCGTVAAIGPLRAMWGRKVLIDDAIARIVAREGLPHAGALAIVGGANSGGELGLSDGETGALSEPEDSEPFIEDEDERDEKTETA